VRARGCAASAVGNSLAGRKRPERDCRMLAGRRGRESGELATKASLGASKAEMWAGDPGAAGAGTWHRRRRLAGRPEVAEHRQRHLAWRPAAYDDRFVPTESAVVSQTNLKVVPGNAVTRRDARGWSSVARIARYACGAPRREKVGG
jgi:hypothetical protein